MRILNPSESDPRLRYEFDRGSGYETELRLTEALSALVPTDDLIHSDHRLFQVLHLVTEYAWVAIHHTLCELVAALVDDDPVSAIRMLRRAGGLAGLPILSLRLLVDSLPPANFQRMREDLTPGSSGLDSPGARGVRKAAHAVWDAFESVLAARTLTIDDLMPATEPGFRGERDISLLSEVLLELHRFDAKIIEWKQVHLNLVWQLLGGHPGTGDGTAPPTSMRGRPLADLERLSARPLFPHLWRQSTALARTFGGARAY